MEDSNLIVKLERNAAARRRTVRGEGLAVGQYMSAIGEFRIALSYEPTQAGARRAMGEYYLSQSREWIRSGLPDQALTTYKKVLAMMPQSAQAHFELGKVYYTLAKYPEAKQEFESVIKIDPYNKQAKHYLAKVK